MRTRYCNKYVGLNNPGDQGEKDVESFLLKKKYQMKNVETQGKNVDFFIVQQNLEVALIEVKTTHAKKKECPKVTCEAEKALGQYSINNEGITVCRKKPIVYAEIIDYINQPLSRSKSIDYLDGIIGRAKTQLYNVYQHLNIDIPTFIFIICDSSKSEGRHFKNAIVYESITDKKIICDETMNRFKDEWFSGVFILTHKENKADFFIEHAFINLDGKHNIYNCSCQRCTNIKKDFLNDAINNYTFNKKNGWQTVKEEKLPSFNCISGKIE